MLAVASEALGALKNNKWLLGLVVGTAAIYYLGDTVVRCTAYFQPKVTIIQQVVKQQSFKDNSLTKRTTRELPDGTKEMLEEIQLGIESLSTERTDSTSVKEPVLLSSPSPWAPMLGYNPVGREIALGVEGRLGPFDVGITHQAVRFGGELKFPDKFEPWLWGSWHF